MKTKNYYVVAHYSVLDTYRVKPNGKRELHTLQPQQLLHVGIAKEQFSHLIGSKLDKIRLSSDNISTIRGVMFVR